MKDITYRSPPLFMENDMFIAKLFTEVVTINPVIKMRSAMIPHS